MSYVLNPYRFAAAADSDYVEATGGTITTEGNYKVHTFLAEGTDFVITDAGSSSGSDTFDYLVVAGGGGGGELSSPPSPPRLFSSKPPPSEPVPVPLPDVVAAGGCDFPGP